MATIGLRKPLPLILSMRTSGRKVNAGHSGWSVRQIKALRVCRDQSGCCTLLLHLHWDLTLKCHSTLEPLPKRIRLSSLGLRDQDLCACLAATIYLPMQAYANAVGCTFGANCLRPVRVP